MHLMGIARASFQELLEDYEDFLRQRGLRKWEKNDPAALEVRGLYKTNLSNRTYKSYLADSAIAANAAICLIHQVNFLLDRQIGALEQQFIKEGDYSEKLSRERNEEKKRQIIGSFWRNHYD